MYHFRIAFEYPWLLLLIIPALGLTLFFYFRSAKKYRRNRNRITSIVLHMLVMTLCVCVLSGIVFLYDVPNTDNQIVLLVDTLEWSEASGGLWECWHDTGVPLAFSVESASS